MVSGRFEFAFGGSASAEGQDSEFFPHKSDGLAKGAGVGEGAEVACLILFFKTRKAKAWPFFHEIHFDEEEAFIVAEADIVAGAELFNEATFEKEGFGFAACDVPLKIPNAFEERAGFDVGAHGAAGHKILADAFTEIASFPDINDAIEAIAH